MLIRIVRMSFKPESLDTFLELFNSKKEKIRSFPGCNHLELWQDHHDKNVFCTYSHWDGEEDLQNYRTSELFKEVWANTKIHFAERPFANSYKQKILLK